MPGLRLIEGAAFDPETTRVMGVAYEQACVALDEDNVAVRELVAKRIIEAARQGERSPAKLVAYGMEGLTAARTIRDTG
jgi:hypothetical protein